MLGLGLACQGLRLGLGLEHPSLGLGVGLELLSLETKPVKKSSLTDAAKRMTASPHRHHVDRQHKARTATLSKFLSLHTVTLPKLASRISSKSSENFDRIEEVAHRQM